jgi:hypothetical protein
MVFLFPLAFLAAIFYNRWLAHWQPKVILRVFLLLNALSILPLYTYFLIPYTFLDRSYNIVDAHNIYIEIKSGESFSIIGIGEQMTDTEAFGKHLSNLYPYDPIFGYSLENYHPQIQAGSIYNISDGYYNMTNPSGYVFPDINGTHPFDRIPSNQKDILESFADHQKSEWKIPLYQELSNWVSGIAIVFVIVVLVFVGFRSTLSYFHPRKETLEMKQ